MPADYVNILEIAFRPLVSEICAIRFRDKVCARPNIARSRFGSFGLAECQSASFSILADGLISFSPDAGHCRTQGTSLPAYNYACVRPESSREGTTALFRAVFATEVRDLGRLGWVSAKLRGNWPEMAENAKCASPAVSRLRATNQVDRLGIYSPRGWGRGGGFSRFW